MTVCTFQTPGYDQFSYSGPDPYGATFSFSQAVDAVVFVHDPTTWSAISVSDDEAMLQENDAAPAQTLAAPVTISGKSCAPGGHVETEHSLLLMPKGATDPADGVEVHVISIDNAIVGLSATDRLVEGQSYIVESEISISPTVLYSDLVVCFAAGTAILTPSGLRRVETLRPGDLVLTADDGPQPLAWVGRQVARGTGRTAPVRIARGALGAQRDLYLSPQHRLVLPQPGGGEVLLAAKALLGRPGVRRAPRVRIQYHHLLFERHQVVFADGAAAESLYPGPMALRSLGAGSRAAIGRALPGLGDGPGWNPARPILRPGRFRRG